MRRILIVLVITLLAVSGKLVAQEHIVYGTSPELYLTHKVVSGDTWYSLGRTYNLPPKDIAVYNKQSMDKPLEIGQQVKIPLTSVNFSQNDNKTAGETLVPLYHVVGEREWMYRISVNHNKVPIEHLEKWNNITRDQAQAGMKLIVGFLKTKGDKLIVKQDPPVQQKTVAADTKSPIKEEKQAPKQETVSLEQKPAPRDEKSAEEAAKTNRNGGYFKSLYTEKGTSSSGVAGIFKSTSGWNDGKYYALINNVVVGTIVKVSFPSTGKSVYAKVLGELPDMKESAGLALRISDAAANELGATNSKFSVTVKY